VSDAPDPRVSDADRELVVDRLREACAEGRLTLEEFSDRVGDVYEARTGTELERLTRDLPADPTPGYEPPRTRWVVGILSGGRRSGPWYPERRTGVVAVLGGCLVDLTDAHLEPDTEIVAVAVFGGVEILVPEGVRADLGGFALFGGRSDRTTGRFQDGPVIRVSCRAFFGGVTVRTRRHPR
jgi:DUF1707 SHOCT-like domain